jgi:hypothetical protein
MFEIKLRFFFSNNNKSLVFFKKDKNKALTKWLNTDVNKQHILRLKHVIDYFF